MKSNELYIHIGYPKTASKFLQFEIFPRLKGIHYVSSPLIRSELGRLRGQNEYVYNEEETRSGIQNHLKEGKNVISNESLMGGVFVYRFINGKLIADRISRLFPKAKIIITLRSQYGIIESLYKQYIQLGGTKRFRDFVNFRNGKFDCSYHGWDFTINPDMFDFVNVLAHYEKLFGRKNILILIYEQLRQNPEEFIRRLTSWIGAEEIPIFTNGKHNQGYGARQIAIARFLNRFLKSKFSESAMIPDVNFPITGKIDSGKLRLILQSRLSRKIFGQKPVTDHLLRQEIMNIYSQSNQFINQKYGLNLETICPGKYF